MEMRREMLSGVTCFSEKSQLRCKLSEDEEHENQIPLKNLILQNSIDCTQLLKRPHLIDKADGGILVFYTAHFLRFKVSNVQIQNRKQTG